jgi:hypothetical protein
VSSRGPVGSVGTTEPSFEVFMQYMSHFPRLFPLSLTFKDISRTKGICTYQTEHTKSLANLHQRSSRVA